MGSGARLRSVNDVFARALSGTAFLITAQPPEPPPPSTIVENVQTWKIGNTSGVWPGAVDEVPVVECGAGQSVSCDTLSGWVFADRPFLSEIFPEGDSYLVGLGYETYPFPAIRLEGVTSGHVLTLPEHCASNTCPWVSTQGAPVDNWASIPGATGVWRAFADALVADQARNPRRFYVTYENALGNPWAFEEDVIITVSNTANTLYAPGPFNILSVSPHPIFATQAVLNLAVDAPYLTRPALYIQGTGLYDGMVEGAEFPDFSGQTANQIVIYKRYTGTATGTVQRVYDQEFDSYWNDFYRIMNENPPDLPSAP